MRIHSWFWKVSILANCLWTVDFSIPPMCTRALTHRTMSHFVTYGNQPSRRALACASCCKVVCPSGSVSPRPWI